jgi:hypothetical protein
MSSIGIHEPMRFPEFKRRYPYQAKNIGCGPALSILLYRQSRTGSPRSGSPPLPEGESLAWRRLPEFLII